MLKLASLLLVMIAIALCGQVNAQNPPYPASQKIREVTFDTSTVLTFGSGSDQWPMTWSSDGTLVASWGDGYGWNGTAKTTRKRSIGVSKISGFPPSLTAEDTWGAGMGQSFGKPDALVAVHDVIHMFWVNGDSKYDDDSYAAVSYDQGLTWTLGTDRIFSNLPAGFRVRGICQFGKANSRAMDGYLYIYFGYNRHPDLYLARVDQQHIFEEDAYEWFTHLNGDGSASWHKSHHRKSAVFHDNQAYLWHISAFLHPDFNRIVLCKPHYDFDDDRMTPFAPKSTMSGLGIFDAPYPWGPWSTIYYENKFLDDHVKFNYMIPGKFLGSEDHSFWMGWSGWPEYDNISFIQGHFRK
ncbi:MAG: hypothetical protein HKN87_01195 [Saprospiraceae bacterium]|nr:hypothetical protein [Saprospiraceae bacterium]